MRNRFMQFGHVGLLIWLALGQACSSSSASSKQPATLSTTRSNVSEEAIGRRFGTVPLGKEATDPSYGYSEKSPVQVGGGFGYGAHYAYRFLNSLSGPGGQEVHYDRVGTCCPFKTPTRRSRVKAFWRCTKSRTRAVSPRASISTGTTRASFCCRPG